MVSLIWPVALALLLASIGLFGLMSYNVARRTNEIGIRIALGANTPQVFRMVLVRALALIGGGLVAGVIDRERERLAEEVRSLESRREASQSLGMPVSDWDRERQGLATFGGLADLAGSLAGWFLKR